MMYNDGMMYTAVFSWKVFKLRMTF